MQMATTTRSFSKAPSFFLLLLLLVSTLLLSVATPTLACHEHKGHHQHKGHHHHKKGHHHRGMPIYVPPTPPEAGDDGCVPSPPTPGAMCPADALKLGACVDLLSGLVHGTIGDPVVHQCCPVLGGLLELEAAVCLCTTIKLKVLDIHVYLPIALQLLVTCGKKPPQGFTCPP